MSVTLSRDTTGVDADELNHSVLAMVLKTVGSVGGRGSAKFQIKGDEVHTYEVSSYVSGRRGERFYSKGNSWQGQGSGG